MTFSLKQPSLWMVIAFLALSVGVARAQVFPDVTIDDENYLAIEYVYSFGSMTGYDDGTFRPNGSLNRAELLKVVLGGTDIEDNFSGSHLENEEDIEQNCFTDVPADAWFAEAVCKAKAQGIVGGYEDGSFEPARKVTVVEAAKIVALAKGFEIEPPGASSSQYWYTPYVMALDEARALPGSFVYANQEVTRGELAEMVWRLAGAESASSGLDGLDRADAIALQGNTCAPSPEDIPEHFDMERVRQTWLDWNNEVRVAAGLEPYVYDHQLGRTAVIWSERAESLGTITHTRPGSSAYYDYFLIGRWFADLGVEFASSGGRSDYVENIGWEYYSCSDEECTDELIAAIRKTFNFFMSEKGQAYAPHYDSIVSPNYNLLGLGIALDESRSNGGKFYLTVHYGTEITSHPPAVCPA